MVVGYAWAFSAAVAQSGSDILRKLGTKNKRFSSNLELVTAWEFTNCVVLACAMLLRGATPAVRRGFEDLQLVAVAGLSGLAKIGCSVLFQRALTLSPVSLSVPYLAFTPALLLFTSYWTLGEKPNAYGVAGVTVLAAGAYALNAVAGGGTGGASCKASARGKSSDVAKSGGGGDEREKDKASPTAAAAAEAGKGINKVSSGGGSVGVGKLTPNKGSFGSLNPRGGGGGRGGERGRASEEGLLSRTSSGSVPLGGGGGGGLVGGKKGAVSILLRPLLCVMPAEPGSRLMLFVAFVWSLTADADKVGYSFASSFLVFMVVQRAVMTTPLVCLCLYKSGVGKCARAVTNNIGFLLLISVMEMYVVAAFLKALDHLFVSYAIAAKRSGILLSVLGGAIFYQEKIRDRLPYILVMLAGMAIILCGTEEH